MRAARPFVPLVVLALLTPAFPAHAEDAGATLTPNDPLFPDQANLAQVRAPLAWDTWTGGSAARLCVLDTGIRATHEDLEGTVVAWNDLVAGASTPYDDHGHGTLVASIAAARSGNALGIAGAASVDLLVAKTLTSTGSGTFADMASGISWCASTGGPRTVIALVSGSSSADPGVESAVLQATASGALVVAPAGSGASVGFPARIPEVLAVGCSTPQETACSFTAGGPELDVIAPATAVWGASHESDTTYRMSNGSSWATALTAGAVALAWSRHPDLTPAQLHARVLATAQDVGEPGREDASGCGELDLADLVLAPLDVTGCGVPTLTPPRALTATPGPGAGEIGLSWGAPLADGGSPVQTYRVHRAASCTGTFELLTEVAATQTSLADTGLGNGATRCYRVTAVTALAESGPSSHAQATTFVPPAPPVSLRAEPGVEPGSVKVRWGVEPGSAPISGFVVERRAGGGTFEEVARVGRVGGYDDRGLDLLGWYSYRVRATNVAGESGPSPVACSRPAPWSAEPTLDPLECAVAPLWPTP